MRKFTIGVVGNGVVGSATARTYLEHVAQVYIYDTDSLKCVHSLETVLASDIIFICLPEGAVPGFFPEKPSEVDAKRCYVIKSTVPIGTTKALQKRHGLDNLIHSPEFLTARCSFTDAQIPSRNIIGIPSEISYGASELHELYHQRFPQVPIFSMSSNESEAVKLIQNSFFAVKVAFWNEMKGLSDKLGMDWNNILDGILSDGRIETSHTQVPGPDGKKGFGGFCLPKDLNELTAFIAQKGLCNLVTSAAAIRNRQIDRREPTP
jgi:UDPglucose 6-dehydrogenase